MNRTVLIVGAAVGVLTLAGLVYAVFGRSDGTSYTMEDAEAAFARTEYAEVVEILTELAEDGNVHASFRLGGMYREGLGTAPDLELAIRYLEVAEQQRFTGAAEALVEIFLEQASAAEAEQDSIPWFERAAELGNIDAIAVLGGYYLTGTGVTQNAQRGVELLLQAAEAGDVRAQTNLGYAYTRGVGAAPDEAEAFRWYLAAAENGLVRAQAAVGLMYETGRGTEVSLGEAVRWYINAADGGARGVDARLGLLIVSQGVQARSTQEASQWVAAAARTGVTTAINWLDERATAGDGDASAALAGMYAAGEGVPENTARARTYYQAAANAGVAVAQLWIAEQYASGTGFEQSYTEAHFWANLAAAAGQEGAAQQRNIVEQFMSAEEVEAAQTRATEWLEEQRRAN